MVATPQVSDRTAKSNQSAHFNETGEVVVIHERAERVGGRYGVATVEHGAPTCMLVDGEQAQRDAQDGQGVSE